MPVGRVFIADHGLLEPFDRGVPITPPSGGGSGGGSAPPGGSGMLIGASIPQGLTNDFVPATQAAAGPWTVARRYQSGKFGATWATDTSGCGVDVGRRATVYSCKPDMAQMAAGTLDAQLAAFVASIPDSHPAFLICWHEPDVKYRQSSGTFDIPLWKAANTRFAQIVKAANKPRVWFGICLTNFSVTGGVPVTSQPQAFWFGPDGADAIIQFVAWDIYLLHDVATTGAHEQQDAMNFCAGHGTAYGIGELGFHEGVTDMGLTAGWLHTQVDYAASRAAGSHTSGAFITFFNSSNGSALPTPSYDPALITASAAISTQYFTHFNTFVL